MKLRAVLWCFALLLSFVLPGYCAIQAQREFDVAVVYEGRWHPTAVDWDASGRMWLAAAAQDSGPLRRGSILVFGKGSPVPRKFYTGPAVGGFVFHRDGVIAGTASGAVWLRDKNGDGVADAKEPL